MKKAGKIVIGLVCVGAFGVLMFTRFTKKEEPIEAVPNPTVVVQTPETGNIELSTGLTGTVEPADQVYIIPKGSGEVLEVYVNQGDTVQKGQKLFRIDNKQLDAARITLNTTQVSLNDAQTSVNRMKALYESGDISAQAYEQAVSGLSMAKLQYDSAKLNYDTQSENTVVTAPIAGVLEQFGVQVHDMSAGGSVAGVVSGAGGKTLTFNVSERVVHRTFQGESDLGGRGRTCQRNDGKGLCDSGEGGQRHGRSGRLCELQQWRRLRVYI